MLVNNEKKDKDPICDGSVFVVDDFKVGVGRTRTFVWHDKDLCLASQDRKHENLDRKTRSK